MPSFDAGGRYIYFAHCPKAGGTSVERQAAAWYGTLDLCDHRWDRWWLNWSGGGWAVADPPCSPQHLTWQDARAVLPRPPEAVFTVVRDPVSRMLSEYTYHVETRRTTQIGRKLRRLGFATWLRLMLRVARSNPYAFDNHFRPQVDFLPPGDDGLTVFHLEDGLGPVMAWMRALSEAPKPDASPETGHSLRSRGAKPVPSRQDLALIARTFAADYDRLGYPRPDPAAAPGDRWAWLRALAARVLAPPVGYLYARGRI